MYTRLVFIFIITYIEVALRHKLSTKLHLASINLNENTLFPLIFVPL